MLAALPAELADLLGRLEASGGTPLSIGAEEVEGWPEALSDGLKAQGAIERTAAATSLECPGCEEACVMPVDVRDEGGREPVAFIVCHKRTDIGRVGLALSQLDRWQMTHRTLAQALSAGMNAGPVTALASGWRLGWIEGAKGRSEVLLTSGRGLLTIGIAGHSLSLLEVLTWDGKRLGIDRKRLTRLAASPVAGGIPPEDPEQRRLLYVKLLDEERRVRKHGCLARAARRAGVEVEAFKKVAYRKPKPKTSTQLMARELARPPRRS